MTPLENKLYELYLFIGNETHRLGNEEGADTDGLHDAMDDLAEIEKAVGQLEKSSAAAQAKSLADERRIEELMEALQFAEAAIEAAKEVYRIKGDLRGYELMGVALSKARAALRVETQEKTNG